MAKHPMSTETQLIGWLVVWNLVILELKSCRAEQLRTSYIPQIIQCLINRLKARQVSYKQHSDLYFDVSATYNAWQEACYAHFNRQLLNFKLKSICWF